jgi:hypothetical protein
MSDPEGVRLNPDGPHSPEHTAEVASTTHEAVRVLNHATHLRTRRESLDQHPPGVLGSAPVRPGSGLGGLPLYPLYAAGQPLVAPSTYPSTPVEGGLYL